MWLPAALAVAAVVEMVALAPHRWGLGIALELVACALLTQRRRHGLAAPGLAMIVTLALPIAGIPLDQPTVPIAILALGMFSLGRYVADLRGLAGFVLVMTETLIDYHWFDDRHHNWSDVVFVLTIAAPPYVIGRVVRTMAEQKAALERAQETIRRQAAREERDRIARELHDVIAHSVSAMVVQTSAAQDLLRTTDPARAESVLADVAATGRKALVETGHLLKVIRDSDNELGLAPVPGLAQVPELVERFRSEGLRVDLELVAPVPALPAEVDVSAYRIVQEALTNALRYGDRTVTLRVSNGDDRLSIHTSNPSSGRTGKGSGLGLLGIAERVSLLGGSLSHGVTADGRFELDALLPGVPS